MRPEYPVSALVAILYRSKPKKVGGYSLKGDEVIQDDTRVAGAVEEITLPAHLRTDEIRLRRIGKVK